MKIASGVVSKDSVQRAGKPLILVMIFAINSCHLAILIKTKCELEDSGLIAGVLFLCGIGGIGRHDGFRFHC